MRRTAEGGRTRIPALTLALLAMLALCACGAGGSSRSEQSGKPESSPAGVKLTLSSAEQADGLIHVELAAGNAAALYQLSSRLTFNPEAVRPRGPARPGNLPAADAIFYSNDRQPDFVPVAFSNRRGEALGQHSGVLYQLEFEVLNPQADPRFNLISDADYLIARDNAAQDIKIELEVQK
ncbi:hypothetical protein KDL44_02250 [bacterium]|nr:hypothetical protein [bacterium]